MYDALSFSQLPSLRKEQRREKKGISSSASLAILFDGKSLKPITNESGVSFCTEILTSIYTSVTYVGLISIRHNVQRINASLSS